jgi:hypothetical protein
MSDCAGIAGLDSRDFNVWRRIAVALKKSLTFGFATCTKPSELRFCNTKVSWRKNRVPSKAREKDLIDGDI